MTLALVGLYAFTGYRRYAVLSFLGAAFLPIGVIMLASREHLLRWGAGFGVVGVLTLAAVVGWIYSQRQRAPQTAPGAPPQR